MAKVRSLGCNPPPFRHSSSCRRDCFRPKAYCHSDCLTMIHSHKIAPKLNLGNHSSWGNGPWATIPPRGMVPFGTSWASRLTFLVQTLISLVRLVPKMFTKVHILVPKRTIPLGGMVALGPFPQEEWFPCCSHGTQKKPRNRPRGSQMRPNIVPTYQKRPTRDPVVTKSAPVRKKTSKKGRRQCSAHL